MAWCENPHCKKDGLRKADVEFDEGTRLVLCHGCMTVTHPGWRPPEEFVDISGIFPTVVSREPKFEMAFQVNQEVGFKALFSYGGMSFTVNVPTEDYQRLFRG
jgi:hypothetical protein